MIQVKQISDLLQRFVTGYYTSGDINQLADTMRSGQSTTPMSEMMDAVWAASETEANAAPTVAEQEKYKAEARELLKRIRKPEKRFSLLPLLKYAAMLVIVLSTGWGIYNLSRSSGMQTIVYTEILVKNGEHKQLTLPDGTRVVLNAGSYMKYPSRFTADTRLIEMDGEAFFEVYRNEQQPFIVRTKDAEVKVLGTSFNVKAYETDEQLAVSVRSGKVQVDLPEAMMRLLPNEQLLFDKQKGEFQKRGEDVNRVITWMKGGLYFNHTPIRSVVYELERMYNCQIEFQPGSNYDDYIYGEHDNKSLESVLKSIQYSTDIRYRNKDGKIILYKN